LCKDGLNEPERPRAPLRGVFHAFALMLACVLGQGGDLDVQLTERARGAHANRTKREYISFDLSPDELPYSEWIARDIEATFGCERMPPEVGTVLVPGVNLGGPRDTRLYDCLFSHNHQWVEPEPSEERTRIAVDPSSFADRLIEVLTVLAAFYHIRWALARPELQNGYFRARTDGVLHKEEMLQALGRMCLHVETPTTLRAMVAARELEALIVAWDGAGAPPDAMVAWASSFLANWDVGENGESLEG
jgi:hypothetical protein